MTIIKKIEYVKLLGIYDFTLSKYIVDGMKRLNTKTLMQINTTWTIKTLSVSILKHNSVDNKTDMKFWNSIFVILHTLDKYGIEPPDNIYKYVDILLAEIRV